MCSGRRRRPVEQLEKNIDFADLSSDVLNRMCQIKRKQRRIHVDLVLRNGVIKQTNTPLFVSSSFHQRERTRADLWLMQFYLLSLQSMWKTGRL